MYLTLRDKKGATHDVFYVRVCAIYATYEIIRLCPSPSSAATRQGGKVRAGAIRSSVSASCCCYLDLQSNAAGFTLAVFVTCPKIVSENILASPFRHIATPPSPEDSSSSKVCSTREGGGGGRAAARTTLEKSREQRS